MYDEVKSKVDEKQAELDVFREMALNKLAYGELDVDTLLRITNRIYDLAYFVGRIEGERYARHLHEFREGLKA